MSASTDFIVIDGVPRATVAKALIEQSRTDMRVALSGIENALHAVAAQTGGIRSAESAPLYVAQLLERITIQVGAFYDAYTAALNLFDKGQELVEDEPPQPEVSHA